MTDSKFLDGARCPRRRPRVASGLAAVVVFGVASSGGTARADWTYELVPSAGVGATDNASNLSKPTPPDSGDGFTTLSGIARARLRGAKAEHVAGYRLAWMHYLLGRGPDNLTNELSWISTFNLLSSLDLKLLAAATYGQTSGYAPVSVNVDVPMAPQQAVKGGANRYLGANAAETLTYQHTPTNRYIETVGVTLLRYLGAGASNILNLDARLRGEWDLGRDHLGLEAVFSRIEAPGSGAFVLGSAAATWRRELSLSWSSELGGGVAAIMPPASGGATQIAPIGHAELDYRRLTWFATLVAGQTPTMNVYIGNATINDSVVARLALPLTKSGLSVLGGYGGYTYGRLVGGGRAYDQRVAGAALAVRGLQWPVWTSLDYTISDQNGSGDVGSPFQSVRRQVVMLNVGGTFIFGPGTPPIFPGAL